VRHSDNLRFIAGYLFGNPGMVRDLFAASVALEWAASDIDGLRLALTNIAHDTDDPSVVAACDAALERFRPLNEVPL
jgi:hypothetical protein